MTYPFYSLFCQLIINLRPGVLCELNFSQMDSLQLAIYDHLSGRTFVQLFFSGLIPRLIECLSFIYSPVYVRSDSLGDSPVKLTDPNRIFERHTQCNRHHEKAHRNGQENS
jgi:hypothetical protein